MARLLIVHPEMDPALITDKLGIQPSQSSRHGQPRVTPKGTTLPGTYTDTRWCMSFRNDENRSIEALVVRYGDAADDKLAACFQRVRVKPLSDSHVRSMLRNKVSANARSCG